MIQDIKDRKLDNSYRNIAPTDDSYVFVFRGTGKANDVAGIKKYEDSIGLPRLKEFKNIDATKLIFLFSIDEDNFFLAPDETEIPEGCVFEGVRIFRIDNPDYLCMAGMTGYHLYCWYRDNRFCGRCGKLTTHHAKLRAKQCECGHLIFPKICPAVIVGVIKEDKILVSRYAGRAYKGVALIAGFCEIGESAEETVKREVLEEVGLTVKNIRYFDTQPWGMDSDLLLGYFCEAEGDSEITLDREELAMAQFVGRDELEAVENTVTLTSTMIEAFRTGLVK